MFHLDDHPENRELSRLHAKFQTRLLAAKAFFFVALGVAALVLAFKL